MNYLDLFSGIGGFHEGIRQALQDAQFTTEESRQTEPEIQFRGERSLNKGRPDDISSGYRELPGNRINWCGFSEIDKYAKSVYQRHFPEAVDLGDIRTIDPDTLPRIDFVTFGFPCQDLSVAGKRQGFRGERSSLFHEALRIIRATKPEVFVFENVTGLYSSEGGRDFTTVLREIASLGLYECQWQTLNTRWFLPQNRERIYFVGYLAGGRRREIFPIGEGDIRINESQGQAQRKGKRFRSDYPCVDTRTGSTERGQHLVGNAISARYYKDGSENLIERTPLKYMNRNQKNIEGDYAFTIDGANTGGIKEKSGIRRLTPTECARLQGFPDDWCAYGHDGKPISDTQQYKMFGNAVSVPVVKAVMERVFK